jgi:signal transduction histidine kinase
MGKSQPKTIIEWNRWIYRILRRKKITTEEATLLEKLSDFLDEYPDNTPLEKWLGFLYLIMEQDREAERILSRMKSRFPQDSEIQNALAYLAIRRGETEKAVTHLLDALYTDENNPKLKQNLNLLRSSENLEAWLATHPWHEFVFYSLPKEDWFAPDISEILSHPIVRWVVVLLVLLLLGTIFFFLYPNLINIAQKYQQIRFRQTGSLVDSYTIQDIEKLVEERQKYSIKLTEEEIGKKFEMIKDLLYEGKRNQALMLINELLNSTAIDAGKITLNRFPCSLGELASVVVAANLHQANQKQQRIDFHAEPNCVAEIDAERIREVFDNLVSNAIKYSPFGKTIWVRVFHATSSDAMPVVRFTVRDEGQGLTEDDMKKLFGRFQRLSAKPTGGESSTGLGLSIAKQLVELHNGKLWAESEGKNMGATFIAELPIFPKSTSELE